MAARSMIDEVVLVVEEKSYTEWQAHKSTGLHKVYGECFPPTPSVQAIVPLGVNPSSLRRETLLLRNSRLALYRLLARGCGLECSHTADRLTVLRNLEVVARVRRKPLQLGMMILAVAAIAGIRALDHTRPACAVLHRASTGRIPRSPSNERAGVCDRLRHRTIDDRIRHPRLV